MLNIFLAVFYIFILFNPTQTNSAGYPNISIQIKINALVVEAGDVIMYTITIKNYGTGDAINLILTDNLPSGFTYEDTGLTSRQWSYTSLSPGEVITETYNAKINNNITEATYITVATVSASNHNPISNKAQITVRTIPTMQILLATQNPTTNNTNIVTPKINNTSATLDSENNENNNSPLGETGVSFFDIILWLIAFVVLIVSFYKLYSIKYKHEFNT